MATVCWQIGVPNYRGLDYCTSFADDVGQSSSGTPNVPSTSGSEFSASNAGPLPEDFCFCFLPNQLLPFTVFGESMWSGWKKIFYYARTAQLSVVITNTEHHVNIKFSPAQPKEEDQGL